MDDKEIERQRYDNRANKARQSLQKDGRSIHGAVSIAHVFRAPYKYYEALLDQVLGPNTAVLEIGSGTGEFTDVLLRSGAKVVATDISIRSLELLRLKYFDCPNLEIHTCDMENIPFENGIFDVVASAGSLSYGDNHLVLCHIHRLLKPGGVFICVDSLNHNPIYRLNRYIHFLRGDRSLSTLQRMPNCDLISKYQSAFGGAAVVQYFGSLSWLFAILAHVVSEHWLSDVSNRIDRLFRVRKSAFKFVLMVRKAV